MWPFRKKPLKHVLRDVAKLPSYYLENRAVRCENCGKTYVMEMFGGWSIEWDFKPDESGWKVDTEDIKRAAEHRNNIPVSQWIMISEDACKGPKAPTTPES